MQMMEYLTRSCKHSVQGDPQHGQPGDGRRAGFDMRLTVQLGQASFVPQIVLCALCVVKDWV